MGIPFPFPYQGSKRKFASVITALFPENAHTLIEPFAGAAAVSLAAAYERRIDQFVLSDVNAPLMALWNRIINQPDDLIQKYQEIWENQLGREKEYYFFIRDEFNRTQKPDLLLFLLVRCVKASVRYNSQGEFNQGPDNRRKGTHPDRMRIQITRTSQLLKGKVKIHSKDYRDIVQQARPVDIVYMDPPYQGVCRNRDPRYVESLAFGAFVDTLRQLNARNIRYIVSYDGRTGSKEHGLPLPATLELRRLEINAGRSSQATLLGKNSITVESLYISPALCHVLDESGYHEPAVQSHYQLRLPL